MNYPRPVNSEKVNLGRVNSETGGKQLRSKIEAHARHTGSGKASDILTDWETYMPQFWQVVPPSEADTPLTSTAAQSADKVLSSV